MHDSAHHSMHHSMHNSVARVVDPFLAAADAALGDRYSAILYGSAARGDYLPGRSDVNLMLLLDAASPALLQSLGDGLRAWRKSTSEPPLVMTRAEWARATDVFPVEIVDMQAGYAVVRGSDPIAGLRVDRRDLRRALEREFRGKLVRLRQGYAALAADPQALGAMAAGTVSSVLVLCRGLLVLLGRPVPSDPAELGAAAEGAAGGNGEPLRQVVQQRRDPLCRSSAAEFEGYLRSVEQVTHFLDQLQLGDA
jgi:hypothetical protein